jgi:hypothetical protein
MGGLSLKDCVNFLSFFAAGAERRLASFSDPRQISRVWAVSD